MKLFKRRRCVQCGSDDIAIDELNFSAYHGNRPDKSWPYDNYRIRWHIHFACRYCDQGLADGRNGIISNRFAVRAILFILRLNHRPKKGL